MLADEDDDSENDEEREMREEMSSYRKELLKMQERIKSLEDDQLEAPGWEMTGEALAKSRPVNSLLEENLEFDRIAKPVPLITVETTEALEEILNDGSSKSRLTMSCARRLPM